MVPTQGGVYTGCTSPIPGVYTRVYLSHTRVYSQVPLIHLWYTARYLSYTCGIHPVVYPWVHPVTPWVHPVTPWVHPSHRGYTSLCMRGTSGLRASFLPGYEGNTRRREPSFLPVSEVITRRREPSFLPVSLGIMRRREPSFLPGLCPVSAPFPSVSARFEQF